MGRAFGGRQGNGEWNGNSTTIGPRHRLPRWGYDAVAAAVVGRPLGVPDPEFLLRDPMVSLAESGTEREVAAGPPLVQSHGVGLVPGDTLCPRHPLTTRETRGTIAEMGIPTFLRQSISWENICKPPSNDA